MTSRRGNMVHITGNHVSVQTSDLHTAVNCTKPILIASEICRLHQEILALRGDKRDLLYAVQRSKAKGPGK